MAINIQNLFSRYYRDDLEKLIKLIAGNERITWIRTINHFNRLNNQIHNYIALVNLIGNVADVQSLFTKVRSYCTPNTRLIVTYYNYLWEPVLKLAEILGLKEKQPALNWLTLEDIENLLYLSGFETVTKGQRLLLPLEIPLLSTLVNRYLARLPLFDRLCLT